MSARLDHKKFAVARTIPDDQYVAIRTCIENGYKPWQVCSNLYNGMARHPYVTAVFFVENYATVSRTWVVYSFSKAYQAELDCQTFVEGRSYGDQ